MDDVTNAARRTGSYIHDLAEEYEVQAKLEAACSKAYALTQQGLRRAGQTAVQLYHRLDVQQRLHRAEQVSMQAAANLDARWRLRQRAADWVQDFRRHWPVRRKRLVLFLQTPLGKVSAVLGLVLAFHTGLVYILMNLMILLSWLGPLAFILLARNQAAQGAAERRTGRAPPSGDQGPVIDVQWHETRE